MLVRQFEYKIWQPRKYNDQKLKAQTKAQNPVRGSDNIVGGHDYVQEFHPRDYVVAGNEFGGEDFNYLGNRYWNRNEYDQDSVLGGSDYGQEDDVEIKDESNTHVFLNEHDPNLNDDNDSEDDGDSGGDIGDINYKINPYLNASPKSYYLMFFFVIKVFVEGIIGTVLLNGLAKMVGKSSVAEFLLSTYIFQCLFLIVYGWKLAGLTPLTIIQSSIVIVQNWTVLKNWSVILEVM